MFPCEKNYALSIDWLIPESEESEEQTFFLV
jgi:hypothetical protein